MKYIIVFLLLPSTIFSQKIIFNTVDPFNKERRVETNYVQLKPGLVQSLQMNLRSAGSAYFINFKGRTWGAGVVGENDSFLFLLDNDSTITITPTELQFSNLDGYYSHQYRIDREQLELLTQHNVKSVRKYYSDKYADLDLQSKSQNKLKELSSLFLQTL